jgi:hypothetical protein
VNARAGQAESTWAERSRWQYISLFLEFVANSGNTFSFFLKKLPRLNFSAHSAHSGYSAVKKERESETE